MKVVALIASYKRDAILRDCLSTVIPQVDEVVLVGSSGWCDPDTGSSIEKNIAKKYGIIYVDRKNSPLGQKWQAGLNVCRSLKPDAVLICGSDDLLSPSYIQNGLSQVTSCRKWLCGSYIWYMADTNTEKIYEIKYKTREDPIGSGRIYSSDTLNAVDWQIFPTTSGIGCDLYSWNIVRPHLECCHSNPGILVSIKGNWPMKDAIEQMLNAQSLHIDELKGCYKALLDLHFPKIDFTKYKTEKVCQQ